jgi:hypothetical protein
VSGLKKPHTCNQKINKLKITMEIKNRMYKKIRTIKNKPMTKIMPPMDNYISWKNTIEKNEYLWVPSFSLGGLLSSLMESSP